MFFAGMVAAQFFVVLTMYPETKGIALEAIEKGLDNKSWPASGVALPETNA